MPSIPAAAVIAAATRLRGHLIESPIVGSFLLAADGRVDLRWKPDLLQPGGSGWFRGYLHLLLRSYGALPGLTFAGPPRRLLAAAMAARQHRLELVAFVGVLPDAALAASLTAVGVAIQVVAEPSTAAARLQRASGFLQLPGAEHPEVAAGLATAGLELAAALPVECEVLYAPADVAPAVEAGWHAGGRGGRIVATSPEAADEVAVERMIAAVELAHRLRLSRDGAAVLVAAQAAGSGPVGAVVVE